MARHRTIILGLVLLPVLGCNDDKVAQLKKQNEELKAQMAKQNAASDFDLQAKCSRAAKQWFNENWVGTSREKATSLLDESNHYNKASNRCFVLVEYHFNHEVGSSWSNDITLWNVFENSKYGEFTENHFISFGDNGSKDTVLICDVAGTKCASVDQFNNLVSPYMNN